MKTKYKAYQLKLFFLGISFTISLISFGQNPSNPDYKDFGLWTRGELQYKYKKWTFFADQQLRTEQNSTALDKSISQFESRFKISRKIRISAGIRYVGINDNQGAIREYENHWRYQFTLRFKPNKNEEKKNIPRLSFQYRIQYQRQKEMGKNELDGIYPRKAWRIRVKAKYNIKNWKLDPSVSYELFFHKQIGSFTAFRFFTGLTRFRIKLETDYKLNDRAKLNFFILKQKENVIWQPPTDFVLGVGYCYLLKNRK
jgi:hypothetical protein